MTRRIMIGVMVALMMATGCNYSADVQPIEKETPQLVTTISAAMKLCSKKTKPSKKKSTRRVAAKGKKKTNKKFTARAGSGAKTVVGATRNAAKGGSVTSTGTVTAAQLDRHFAKYNGKLMGKGAKFIEMERKYGISAKFMAAIATQESGAGNSKRARSINDCFGMTGYGKKKRWGSVDENIECAFSLISRVYVQKGRTTVASIGKKYCVGGNWAAKVQGIMNRI